jgi:hypothetical protein
MPAMLALVAGGACARMFPEPEFPAPQSSLEAARLAESRRWTGRIVTMERDTIVGQIHAAGSRIQIQERDLAPGDIYRMERRTGSSHISRKTVLGMMAGALGAFIAGELNVHNSGPGYTGAPPLTWAAAGASSGMVVAVVAQFGTDESRWESIWSQYGN